MESIRLYGAVRVRATGCRRCQYRPDIFQRWRTTAGPVAQCEYPRHHHHRLSGPAGGTRAVGTHSASVLPGRGVWIHHGGDGSGRSGLLLVFIGGRQTLGHRQPEPHRVLTRRFPSISDKEQKKTAVVTELAHADDSSGGG